MGASRRRRVLTSLPEWEQKDGTTPGSLSECDNWSEAGLVEARSRAECLPSRPKVFFEEWDGPLISGIGWVSELIEIAGGIDIFADRRNQSAARDRVVTVEKVVAREPDLII